MAVLQTDNKRQTIHGVLLIFVSGCFGAILVFLIRWYSERMQYSTPKILLHFSLFQLVYTLISSVVLCDLKFSINIKNTLNLINSIKDTQSINTKRISINANSDKKPLNLHKTTPSKSTSYGSLTTFLSTQHFLPSNHSLLHANYDLRRKQTKGFSKISLYFIEELSPLKLCVAILCQSILNVLAICTLLESKSQIPIADTLSLNVLSIIISAVIGWIVLDDPLSRYHIIGIIVVIVSSIMIIQPPMILRSKYLNDDLLYRSTYIGYILAIVSALCVALLSLFIRISSRAPPFLVLLSQCICNIVGYIVMVWCNQRIEMYHNYDDVVYSAVGGLILYLFALTLTKGTQKLIVGAANIIQTTSFMVLGWILFDEDRDYIGLIGICLSVIAVIVISIERVKEAYKLDKSVFEGFDCTTYNHREYGGYAEKDLFSTNYAFDDDEKAGYSTLIL